MILSGARGKLLSVDAKSNTVRILRRSAEEDYECEGEFDLAGVKALIGKRVDLELRDFVVIGVTRRADE